MNQQVLFILLALVAFCWGQTRRYERNDGPFYIGVKNFSPFVEPEEAAPGTLLVGNPEGFSVDYAFSVFAQMQQKIVEQELTSTFQWNTIQWVYYGDAVDDLITAVEAGEVHLGIAGITITAERESRADFTTPYFTSGLQVLRRLDTSLSQINLFGFLDPLTLGVWLTALVGSIIAAHVIWLMERSVSPDVFPDDYFGGLSIGVYWAFTTILSSPLVRVKGISARIFSLGYLFFGIVLIAAYTANLATLLTSESTDNTFLLSDLEDEQIVAYVEGSASAAILEDTAEMERRNWIFEPRVYQTIEQALNDIVAYDDPTEDPGFVIFDSPYLLDFYARNESGADCELDSDVTCVEVVGAIIEPEAYGMLIPSNASYFDIVQLSALAVEGSGTLDSIYSDYFGALVGNTVDIEQFDFWDISGILIILVGVALVSLTLFVVTGFLFGNEVESSTLPRALQGVLKGDDD